VHLVALIKVGDLSNFEIQCKERLVIWSFI